MRWTLAAALLVVACAPQAPPRHAGDHGDQATPVVIPSKVAIEWKPGVSRDQIAAEEHRLGLKAQFNSPELANDELSVADGDDAAELAALRKDPLVQSAEPVFEYDELFVPNDPDYGRQWHLQQIGAEQAWEWGTGAGVIVAVIDTGVAELSDLPKSVLVDGYDFVAHKKGGVDDQGHGSHVAGTIAQATNNGTGVAGVAHGARIMPVKVLNAFGAGRTPDIADGIRWAVDHGAKVLNLSLGGGAYSQIMADAVRYAHDKGAVVVCAAGNTHGPVNYPAAYEGALAVSAVRFDHQLAPYSSFGSEIDIAAPGGDTSVDQNHDGFPDGVLQQTLGGEFKWYQGTSMAAPHVAGVAALLASIGVTRGEAIEDILLETASPLGDATRYGHGEVDAAAAVRHVRLNGGLWRFGLALVLTWLAAMVVRRNGEKRAAFGLLGWPMLMFASSGLFVLPLLGYGHTTASAFLATPLPEWGQMLNGAQASSPLWLSALAPFVALGASRIRALQGVSAALCLGIAAYLIHGAFVGWVDIAWIPGRVAEGTWLFVNGILAFAFGTVALRVAR